MDATSTACDTGRVLLWFPVLGRVETYGDGVVDCLGPVQKLTSFPRSFSSFYKILTPGVWDHEDGAADNTHHVREARVLRAREPAMCVPPFLCS
jgi:hypothetical protein